MDPFLKQMLWGLVPTLVAMGLVLLLGRKKPELPIPALALWLGLLAGTVGLLQAWPAFPPKTALLALPYVLILSLVVLVAPEKNWARLLARVLLILGGLWVFLAPLDKYVFDGGEYLFWWGLLGISWLLLAPCLRFALEERPRLGFLQHAILAGLAGVCAALTGSLFLGQLAGLLGLGMGVLYVEALVAGPNFRREGVSELFTMFYLLSIALMYLASSTPPGVAILLVLGAFAPILSAIREKGSRPLWLYMGPSFLLALAATVWAWQVQ